MKFTDRLLHSWNAFRTAGSTYPDVGVGSSAPSGKNLLSRVSSIAIELPMVHFIISSSNINNLARARLLIFDEEIMKWTMGNSIAIEDNNGNYKLSKMRNDEKIDNVSALLDAWVIYKRYQEAFE